MNFPENFIDLRGYYPYNISVNVSLIPLAGKVSFLYWHIQIESFTQYLSINSFWPYGWSELFLCEKESN